MHKLLLSTAVVGALAATAIPASAMPGTELPLASSSAPVVTLVSGGCGPFRHRGWDGFCRPNGGPVYGYGWHRPWGWHHWHHW